MPAPARSVRADVVAGAKLQSIHDIVAELHAAKLPVQTGQSAIQAAQAARVLQHTLEGAKSTAPADLLASWPPWKSATGTTTCISPGPATSNRAGPHADRQFRLVIQWAPDNAQNVVFPSDFAQTDPRPGS